MSTDQYCRVLQAGESLFREGEAGDCAFVIESGALEVSRAHNGARDVLAVLGPGEMLGEMSLIDRLPRSASAAARIPTRLRIVTRDHLQDKMEQADPLLRLLIGMILKRYRSATSGGASSQEEDQSDRKAVLKRLELEQELEQALKRNEFVLYYQPIVHLSNFAVAGFEALIRWNSPSRGFVSPGVFMPAVEDSPLIHGVGRWVMNTACAMLEKMNKLNRPDGIGEVPLFMSLNLSGKQLADDMLVQHVQNAISKHNVKPSQVKLEITETLMMHNLQQAVSLMEKCREFGAQIAMDDFGTGYSSLSYLNHFPINTLKIDQSFVKPMLTNEGSRKIVSAVGRLAKSLNMNVVAEGVEEYDHAAGLADLDIEYAQGYLFSKPVDGGKACDMVMSEWPWAFARRRHPRAESPGVPGR